MKIASETWDTGAYPGICSFVLVSHLHPCSCLARVLIEKLEVLGTFSQQKNVINPIIPHNFVKRMEDSLITVQGWTV